MSPVLALICLSDETGRPIRRMEYGVDGSLSRNRTEYGEEVEEAIYNLGDSCVGFGAAIHRHLK